MTEAVADGRGWLKYAAVVLTVGGLSLHLMGHATHARYLAKVGAEPGLFPKSVDWLAMNGYYTAADRFLLLLRALGEHVWLLAAVGGGLGLYAFALERLVRNCRPDVTRFTRQMPEWAGSLLKNVGGTTTFFVVVPFAVASLFLVTLLPGVAGETAADKLVERSLRRFAQGCEDPSDCTQLLRSGQPVALGHVIDASEAHIAIYDIAVGRTRILETGGLEIIGPRPDRDVKGRVEKQRDARQ